MSLPSRFRLQQAARLLENGGLIAYPTEGVWGLGCDPMRIETVFRLLELKGRDAGKGLILVAGDLESLEPYLQPLGMEQRQQVLAPSRHPITWVCPALPDFDWLTGGRTTLAVRVSSHPVIRELSRRTGMALVSTSANPSGRRAALSALQVRRYFGSGVDMICPGSLGGATGASEIRDLASGAVLRPAPMPNKTTRAGK